MCYKIFQLKLCLIQFLCCFSRKMTGDELMVHFAQKYNVEVAFFHYNAHWWLRICANIYNRREDYLKLKDALQDMFSK